MRFGVLEPHMSEFRSTARVQLYVYSSTGTVFLYTGKSWLLELLAFDEYCRFDTAAFFW
jgi:hypothetical protein